MTRISALLFDADGVLQHATADREARIRAVFGFVPDDLDELSRDVFAAERPTLTGEGDFVEAMVPVVAKWGAPGTASEFAKCWQSIEVDGEILALIARLQQAGYLCALATNQQSYRATHMAKTLGYDTFFDRSFYSCELGFAKPDPQYFDAIVDCLSYEPTELLFVDDSAQNVEGAKAAGLNAVQFVHPRSPQAVSNLVDVLNRFSVNVPKKTP